MVRFLEIFSQINFFFLYNTKNEYCGTEKSYKSMFIALHRPFKFQRSYNSFHSILFYKMYNLILSALIFKRCIKNKINLTKTGNVQ